jgi:hypothetical protein
MTCRPRFRAAAYRIPVETAVQKQIDRFSTCTGGGRARAMRHPSAVLQDQQDGIRRLKCAESSYRLSSWLSSLQSR